MYIIYLIVTTFCLYYVNHKYSKRSDKAIALIWFLLLVLMGTFGFFTDDYEPYEDQVAISYASPYSNIHMESIWIGLAELCKGNITCFRLISFSSLAIVLFLICKILNIHLKYFICYYSLICLSNHLCWIRQPLAMSIFILGIALILKRHYLIAIPILIISTLFHKSSLVFICLLAFNLIPLSKKYIWIYLFSGAMLIIGFNLILRIELPFTPFLLYYLESDNDLAYRNLIIILLANLSFLLNLCLLLGSVYYFNNVPNKIVILLTRFITGLICIAVSLLFVPFETGAMITRIMAMATMCNVFVLSICLKSKIYFKKYNLVFRPLILQFIIANLLTIGNNHTRIYRLTKPFG